MGFKKNIVITGASRGIGRAIALRFAKAGFQVAVCSRNQEKLDDLEQALNSVNADLHHMLRTCDVSDEGALKSFCNEVIEQWGSVEVLVNNAGIFIPGNVLDEAEGNLQKVIETNLYSAYHCARAFAPILKVASNGLICNISSVAGLKAYPEGGSYSISKFALTGLSKALREELKETDVRVTTLYPGAVLTDSWSGTDLPDSRFMKPEDVAELLWSIYALPKGTVVEDMTLRPQLGDI